MRGSERLIGVVASHGASIAGIRSRVAIQFHVSHIEVPVNECLTRELPLSSFRPLSAVKSRNLHVELNGSIRIGKKERKRVRKEVE